MGPSSWVNHRLLGRNRHPDSKWIRKCKMYLHSQLNKSKNFLLGANHLLILQIRLRKTLNKISEQVQLGNSIKAISSIRKANNLSSMIRKISHLLQIFLNFCLARARVGVLELSKTSILIGLILMVWVEVA